MKIYETKMEAGTKQWLEIPVDEECSLKAAAFCGSRPGKRLIVTAGVHGCEYIGILALSCLIQELDPRQMKGEAVFLPIANEGGFYKEIKQLVPEDGINLNRAFPGTEMGSRSAKIAAAVETSPESALTASCLRGSQLPVSARSLSGNGLRSPDPAG